MIYNDIIAACWIVLWGYWLVSAFYTKKTVGRQGLRSGIYARLAIFAIIVLILRSPAGRQWLLHAHGPLISASPARAIGAALCVCGVAFALWARVHLGRNWGMPMSLRQDPELVTSGPYGIVRHPIYTGFLAAALGSAFANSAFWLIIFFAFGAYFIYSATREEKNMTLQFPGAYPDYRKRTKMLIPFVF